MAKKKIFKKNKVNSQNFNKEIISISLIILGLLSLISLFSSKMGIIGNIFYKIFTFLCGSGNFIFPILFIVWGLLYGFEKFRQNFFKIVISGIIITLCILVFLDGTKTSDLTLIDRISLSIQYLDIATSGGILGSILGFFLYKLFGSIGTYIILSLIIVFNFYLLVKYNKEFFSRFSEKLSSFRENLIEKSEKRKFAKEEKKGAEKNFDTIEEPINLLADEKKDFLIKDFQINQLINEESSDLEEDNIMQNPFMGEPEKENKDKTKIIEKELNKTNFDFDKELEEEKLVLNKGLEKSKNIYSFPKIDLLNNYDGATEISKSEIIKNGQIIQKTMENFGIECKIVAINRGPVITCYELEPAAGVKLSKIVSLNDNLSLSLASSDIRIEAPIPGKSAVGIEVPNKNKQPVTIREIIGSNKFKNSTSHLPLALGKDVSGSIEISSIDKMPHLLIAGATGSGKSVCINTIIVSILYKSSPDEVKLMLIDPKVVELSVYNGIPHLLIPVVTDPKKAAFALNWAVGEMERRYKIFAENAVRDLTSYNNKVKKAGIEGDPIPKIVIIIDELSDLMMASQAEVEDYITRLAQMARAAGIYLIIATQRPSVDVITGTIKANIPSRIAFAVSSSIDSRTILDMSGAEKLLGKGDMLFYPGFYSKPVRLQGAFISDDEVEAVVNYVKENSEYDNPYENKIKNEIKEKKDSIDNAKDPLFAKAVEYILMDEQASISFLQRKLKVGYSRAARIVDQMEESGIIGPYEGSKPRKILMSEEDIRKLIGDDNE
ncbi:FtsK/SpoIIIE family DNA translocase [Peptoniphilus catoniae]|uniref:FtsK/SpoIIIE family DNA translocase n=1 Tax=Peptoniphilus catoniae TaxID=1660341 RepID=UPI0010FE3831|nr:DNA translocase FtsK [Peptoniphilus catoniae]